MSGEVSCKFQLIICHHTLYPTYYCLNEPTVNALKYSQVVSCFKVGQLLHISQLALLEGSYNLTAQKK